MVKTTVYLPDELHQGVKQAAKERGTSEAELIRTAESPPPRTQPA